MKPAMIRTMDSQGRIIIPHEIRRTMNLSGGDTIEIRTVENGVLLSKYKSASAGDCSMKKYLNILYSVTRCGAAICTEDQVIVSKGLCVMEGTTISEPLQDYIRSGKQQIFTEPVYLTDTSVSQVDTLIPLSAPDRFWQSSALVVIKGRREITESERACARLIAALISSSNI